MQTLDTPGPADAPDFPEFGLSPRAMGNYRNGSDIDITLDAPGMESARFLHLCTAADDLMLPWTMDLSLLSHIDNPALLSHIHRVGKPLWVRDGA